MLVNEILEVINGKLIIGDIERRIEDYSIDTRTIKENEMYVAIKGETLDGNIFIEEALKKGAVGVIFQGEIDETIIDKYPEKIIIKVYDTVKAIQELAMYKRQQYDIPVVAITGSVGKTSTKDIVASVMSQKYDVLKTEGNFNNQIGLPLTILKLKNHTAVCVEMGMNQAGEISKLTNIVKPIIAVITNVGTAHIGNLGTRENILKAKLEILDGLRDNGTLVINNDNDLLNEWNKKQKSYSVVTYGIENISNYMAKDIVEEKESSNYIINFNGNDEKIVIKIPGLHFIYNSLCAITVGRLLNIDIDNIKKGIDEFKLSPKRMEIKKSKIGATILEDCYNANFDSMKASLSVLAKYHKNRKIAVLGDMLELGDYSDELHAKVGSEVARNKIDVLIVVGKYAKKIAENAVGIELYTCTNNKEAINILNKIIHKDDVILFKASNAMKFNEIVENVM